MAHSVGWLMRPVTHPLSELTAGLWSATAGMAIVGWVVAGPWGAGMAALLGPLLGCGTVAFVLARHFAEPRPSEPYRSIGHGQQRPAPLGWREGHFPDRQAS